MIRYFKALRSAMLPVLASVALLSSCNKDLDQMPDPTPAPTTLSVGQFIATSPSYTLFRSAVEKAGLMSVISDLGNNVTVFAANDIAMTNSGLTSTAIAATSAAQLKSMLQYHIVTTKVTAGELNSQVPNLPLPSLLVLDPTNPYVKMTIFPSIRGLQGWVNNVPFKADDQVLQNGVLHSTAGIVTPPSKLLYQLVAEDANLSVFKAALARADVGQTDNLAKFSYLLQYGVTNMTVLAPTNAAFAAIGVTSADVINAMPVDQVRGIVAYHILASNVSGSYKPDVRYYSVNFPTAAGTFVKTLVNGSVAAHPGILVQSSLSGTAVSSLKFTGYGTVPAGGTPYSRAAATVTGMDKNAVNGVLHVIDQVLMPQ